MATTTLPPMPVSARRFVALVLALAALAGGCAGSGADEGRGTTESTTTTTVPATTTSVPPGGRQPTPEDPLRVTFAGDSVMAEFAPALIDALESSGSTVGRFVLSPSIARDGSTTLIWQQELADQDPELIVQLVGFWEDQVVGETASNEPGWAERYRARVVEPFLDMVTAEGAKVLWIGMAAVNDPAVTERFARLNAVYAQVAEARDDTDYLAAGDYLSGPDGGYAEIVTSPTSGQPVRLRRIDGLHLCPEGVAALGAPVLDRIAEQWNVTGAFGWQDGAWRRPPLLHAPEECPAPA